MIHSKAAIQATKGLRILGLTLGSLCFVSTAPAKGLDWVASFDDTREDLTATWSLEGTGTATIREGTLLLQETPDGVGVVLWTRRNFPANFRLSFDLSFSNNRGIGVIFFAARAADGGDALRDQDQRTGVYDDYIRGALDSYSLSLHRYWPDGRNNPGSNLRRNSGFHLLDQALPDPCLTADKIYHVEIHKQGSELTVRIDGEQTHHAVDDGSHGPPHTTGRIGFRLRGDASCVMRIDNIRVVEE